ncbi:hypothetical protein GW17_00040594 [Ensete ventricosum]|nr:hypothetical protein GW17_00040594 [Ensete ventricosum]
MRNLVGSTTLRVPLNFPRKKKRGYGNLLSGNETCEIKQLSGTPTTMARRLATQPRGSTHTPQEPDTLSSDSIDSLRVQLHQVNRRLDEVQNEFVKSKEELGESSKGGSPFVLEIQDRPILTRFRLPSLESYDGGSDPAEHVAAFRAQMALYDTSDALICRCFLTR